MLMRAAVVYGFHKLTTKPRSAYSFIAPQYPCLTTLNMETAIPDIEYPDIYNNLTLLVHIPKKNWKHARVWKATNICWQAGLTIYLCTLVMMMATRWLPKYGIHSCWKGWNNFMLSLHMCGRHRWGLFSHCGLAVCKGYLQACKMLLLFRSLTSTSLPLLPGERELIMVSLCAKNEVVFVPSPTQALLPTFFIRSSETSFLHHTLMESSNFRMVYFRLTTLITCSTWILTQDNCWNVSISRHDNCFLPLVTTGGTLTSAQ